MNAVVAHRNATTAYAAAAAAAPTYRDVVFEPAEPSRLGLKEWADIVIAMGFGFFGGLLAAGAMISAAQTIATSFAS